MRTFHYPERMSEIAWKDTAIKSSDADYVSEKIMRLFTQASRFRDKCETIHDSYIEMEGRLIELRKQRKQMLNSNIGTADIDREISFASRIMGESASHLLKLRKEFIADNMAEFTDIEQSARNLDYYPESTLGRLRHHFINVMPHPDEVYADAVQMLLWIHLLEHEVSGIQNRNNFRKPKGEKPYWYFNNKGVVRDFNQFWSKVSQGKVGFMLRIPLPDRNVLASMSRSPTVVSDVESNMSLDASIREFLKFQMRLIKSIQNDYEKLRQDYPDLVRATPATMRNVFERELMVPPVIGNKPFEKIDQQYADWYEKIEKNAKKLLDFAILYTSVKSLYPMTVGMKEIGRARNKNGRDGEHQAYVESLNVLLDNALGGKSLNIAERKAIHLLKAMYPKHPKINEAYRSL